MRIINAQTLDDFCMATVLRHRKTYGNLDAVSAIDDLKSRLEPRPMQAFFFEKKDAGDGQLSCDQIVPALGTTQLKPTVNGVQNGSSACAVRRFTVANKTP